MLVTPCLFAFSLLLAPPALPSVVDGQEGKGSASLDAALGGLRFRELGPALPSGRVGDFAVDPDRPHRFFVAVSSGGVWKTENNGITYQPVFDGEGSYSIGCVELDPNNPNVVWVGSGENNSQRSVSFGDGVYKSLDGGKSWKNLGLKDSEHIGMIAIDPRDSDVVFVAAQGPLWRSGGDRGLYKTSDGGASWECVLDVGPDTGANEVHMDPRDPDVIYVSTYQRRRHVWTLINGGPESAIYKSTDGGVTFRKLTRGLPSVDLGRIGMDISPKNPDVIYAIVEAQFGKGGVFRSTDRGETWEKRSSYMSSSPQYYNELVCDPNDVDTFYSLNTFLGRSTDGGKTVGTVPGRDRHVDDHALWIDPEDSDHLLIGCDGGIYRSHDRGQNWDFSENLPVTQFYRVALDNSSPFYFVYGGTQDNNTLGGPARTISPAGISSEDWFITVGGDGFEPAIDPDDPNTVYSQWQHGGLIRYDRESREVFDIKPQQAPGEEAHVFNWDSPLLISPHHSKRLYFAGRKLFRSDDRGNSWTAISGELQRDLDREQLPVMGRIQSTDAVSKNRSTSIYGNAVALTESPLVEGLLYVGTDDGLVHVTEDGGDSWRRIEAFPGIPDRAYVSDLEASLHDPNVVFVSFSNHKMGDFKPYLLVSRNRGQTWRPISTGIGEKDIVWAVAEDHVDPMLLFAGTEFGVRVSVNGGGAWHEFDAGLPTIAVRDLEIQRREDDLVLATFGRGFFVMDDYSPLRRMGQEALDRDAFVFPIRCALQYEEASRLGGRSGRGSQGATYYTAENPPYGAVVTYWLKDKIQTRKEIRREAEKPALEAGEDVDPPSWDALRAEDVEETPEVFLTVRDTSGEIVRRVATSREKGLHRVAWDLRFDASDPVSLSSGGGDLPEWMRDPVGPQVLPGTYHASIELIHDGALSTLAGPVPFEVVPLDLVSVSAEDRAAAVAFRREVLSLQRAVDGANSAVGEAFDRIAHLKKAVRRTPAADPSLLGSLKTAEARLRAIQIELTGDRTKSSRFAPADTAISSWIGTVAGNQWYTTQAPSKTERLAFRHAGEAFEPLLESLRKVVEQDLRVIEEALEAAGAPWTPGRIPTWKRGG